MAEKLSYKEINKIPSLTWNWLKMNRASLEKEIPGVSCDVQLSKLPRGVTMEDETYPDYERLIAIKGGSGEDAADIIRNLSYSKSVIVVEKDCQAQMPLSVRYSFRGKASYADRLHVIAEEGSSITVIMVYDSTPDAEGFFALQNKVLAKKNSTVNIIKVQLLAENFTSLDDLGIEEEEGAKVTVTQIELGGDKAYAGVSSLLSGSEASFKSRTAYAVGKNQLLDMNYVVTQTGKKTDCDMQVKGVVDGKAVKIHRGTIDFKNGCQGATGNEQEETLLLSSECVNKSIPVILCDEEDVSGTHGASIGRLEEEELFYINSRGIGEEAAKQMMSRAKIESVAREIPDEKLVKQISQQLDSLYGE